MRRDLPDNLYERAGYYSWRNPGTGKEYGIGRDRAQAIREAKEANSYLDKRAGGLVQRIAEDVRTVAAFAPRFRETIEKRRIAPITRYHRKRYLAHLERDLGHVVVGPRMEDAAEITRQFAEYFKRLEDKGRSRTAKGFRTTAIDMFTEMAAAGWVAVNPIEVTRVEPYDVMRARLTLEHFMAIYEKAGELYPWAPRTMELALVSLQRRADIADLLFRDQEDGRLLVEQGKSWTYEDNPDGAPQMRLRIPLELRLQAVNWSLGEIIGRCRDRVVSRHLVHHARSRGKALAGGRVHPQSISRAFAKARELAGITPPAGKTPPTFHEIRSLGIRLYEKQGYNAQVLAGHRKEETTALYKDSRGAEWIDVAA